MKKGPSRTILPALRLGHVVEDQKVEVGVGGQDLAYALLERIGEMNRSRFLPVIERVFDEFDRPGEIIRIDRLDLDLGTLRESELGRAEERLGAALREALRKAIPPAGVEPDAAGGPDSGPAAARGLGDALVDAFRHFLLHGAWPYGSALDLATAPADLLDRLIATEPAALAAMLRRHGGSEALVQRLVRQIPPELLERLLTVLEPADAAWILVYMKETKASHEQEPLVEEEPDAFERLLWTIVLRDALHRAGLRSNRRAFLRKLIGGIAEAGSCSYAELLAQLASGLAAVPGTGRGADSLVSIIRELASEERGSAPPRPASFADVVRWLETGEGRDGAARDFRLDPAHSSSAARRLSAGAEPGGDKAALATALRSHPAEARWLLARLVRRDGERVLERLEGALAPEEFARLLLPAERARQIAGALRAARGARAVAALLRLALSDAARLPAIAASRSEPDSVVGPRLAERGAEAPMHARSEHRGTGRKDEAADLSPLARIETALSLGPAGDGIEWSASLASAIAAASAADPVGLRRMMRRFALADPSAFVEQVGASAGTRAAIANLVAPPSGETLANFAEIFSVTPSETVSLVAMAATAPVSATPQTLVRQAVAALARARGETAESMRRALLARARRSGGVEGRRLAGLLVEGAEPPIRPSDPESLRAATLDALRAMLNAPGSQPIVVAPSAALLSSLSGMSAGSLRDHLGGPSLRLDASAAALGQLDDSALIRLILLLAPGRGETKAALRDRLGRSRRRAALAAIAAELLATGSIDPEREAPQPIQRPRAASGAAELRLIERAVRKGGAALAAPEVREALARLLAKRPFELIRLLAAPGSGQAPLRALAAGRDMKAAGPLLRDPLILAAAFGALPAAERDLAASLAQLLAGTLGRSAVPAEKAASALALAAAAMLARPGGTGLAARWLDEMLRSASLSERSTLRRLIASRWPGDKRDRAMLAALGSGQRDEAAAPQPLTPKPGSKKSRTAAKDALDVACPDKGSIAWLNQLLRDRPRGYERLLRRFLRGAEARERARRFLPETLLVQLLAAVAPGEARALLGAAELVAKALESSGGAATRGAMWDAVLAAAAEGQGVEALLERLLGARAGPGLRLPPDGAQSPALWDRLDSLARSRGHAALRAALDEHAHERRRATARSPIETMADRRRRPDREGRIERKLWEGIDDEAGLRIAIHNAGLVLASPFLPAFFARLDLLDPADPDGKSWRSTQARDRAVHLLQFLVEERCDRPEPVLALNKLLCGQSLGFPVSASIEPNESERSICRSLLEAMVANWPMLNGSSVAALQETFLQREGCIVRIEGGWRVDVERKVLDVLVDAIPWSFSMILHPWMEELISTSW